MSDFVATTSPGLGFQITNRPIRVKNVGGTSRVRGSVLTFLATSAAGHFNPPNFKFGDPDSAYVLVGGPPTATFSDGFGIVCCLDATVENQAEGKAWLWHPELLVLVDGATTIGQPLTLTTTNNSAALDATPTAGARVAGIAHQAVGGLGLCLASFFGVLGIGKGGP